MASSNVDFYQRQKELQASLHEKEQERLRLEQQLYAYFKTDKRLSKLRAAKLQSYWKRICSDEEKSRQRNEKILRDFERIEGHLSSVTSRTEKLKLLKEQYEKQLKEKYPEWKKFTHPEEKDQETMKSTNHPHSSSIPIQQQHSQDSLHNMASPPKQFQSNIGAVRDLVYDHNSKVDLVRSSSHSLHRDPEEEEVGFMEGGELTVDKLSNVGGGMVNKREYSHEDITSQTIQEVDDEDKLAEVNEQEEGAYKPYTYTRPPALHPSHSRHEAQVSEHRPSMETLAEEEDEEVTDYGDVFAPEETLPIRPPLTDTWQLMDNMTLEARLTDPNEQAEQLESATPRSLLRSDSASIKSNSPLPDLSLDGLLFLLKCLQNEIPHAVNIDGYYRCQHPPLAARKEIVRKANSAIEMVGMDGNAVSMVILEQLTLVVRELPGGCLLADEVLIKSANIVNEIHLRAHLTKESQLMWVKLFEHFCTLLKHQVMGPQEIAAVFVPGLVADKSENQDKAFSLIVRLLESSLEAEDGDEMSSMTFSSRANILLPDGPTRPKPAEDVPLLSFGSIIDKQTDDESDFFEQSLPKDSVPLNETDAYKNMLSGTGSSGLPTIPHREEEDTDDDVEKQFASVLSPRTPRNKTGMKSSPRPRTLSPTAPDPILDEVMSEISSTSPPVSPPPVQNNSYTKPGFESFGTSRSGGLKIGSDLDSDTELDFPMSRGNISKSKTSLDDDFDFYG